MSERQNISSGGKWEGLVGYSRAVRVGTRVIVSGSTAAGNEGNIVRPNDAYAQTVQAILNIESALTEAGATLQIVLLPRMFVTDISNWQEYGLGHGDFF